MSARDLYLGNDFHMLDVRPRKVSVQADTIERKYFTSSDVAAMIGIERSIVSHYITTLGMRTQKYNANNRLVFTSDQVNVIREFHNLVREGFSWKEAYQMIRL